MCSTGPIGPGPGPESPALRPWVELYAPMVYSSACRRTGCAHRAAQATRAVFFILARRWRKLGKRAVPAGWLFQATAEACRLLTKRSALQDWWRWRKRRPARLLPPEAPLWIRIAPGLDHAIDQLPSAQRDALLLSVFLNQDPVSVAGSLRLSETPGGQARRARPQEPRAPTGPPRRGRRHPNPRANLRRPSLRNAPPRGAACRNPRCHRRHPGPPSAPSRWRASS